MTTVVYKRLTVVDPLVMVDVLGISSACEMNLFSVVLSNLRCAIVSEWILDFVVVLLYLVQGQLLGSLLKNVNKSINLLLLKISQIMNKETIQNVEKKIFQTKRIMDFEKNLIAFWQKTKNHSTSVNLKSKKMYDLFANWKFYPSTESGK